MTAPEHIATFLHRRRQKHIAMAALSGVGAGGGQTRRQFLSAGARIGAQAVAVSVACDMRARPARAQSPSKVTRVGFVAAGPRPTLERPNMFLKAFQEELRTLGLPESETFVVESRFAEGNFDRIPSLVADLVRLDVKVIFAPGTPA